MRPRLLWALALLLLSGAAQAASYTFRSDSFVWESTSNTITWDRLCTGYPGDDDQATINFTGGFTFTFAGTAYSSVRVLANGMLQFGSDTGFMRNYNNTALPAGNASNSGGCAAGATVRMIMVYWTDLNPSASGSGGVTWEQKGTAPNRSLVVTWNSVYQYNTATPYTFQVILFENGEFKFQYGNSNASGANATIGVQVSSSDFAQYSYNSGYNANGSAIRWTVPSSTATRAAEYRFDEYSYSGTVGEVTDSSGNSRAGVRVGSAASTATGQVCRGLDVPANTSTAISAVDTLVDIDGVLSSAGSISLWYRSSATWSSTTAALLFDATTTATRPFYLMRASGGAVRFSMADTAGTVLTATTAASSTAANTWVHVATTWRLASGSNQSVLRVYINGVLSATANGTTTGALDNSLGTLFLGDNRSSATPSGGTANSAAGQLDEVRIYNYEISPSDVAIDMAANHACPPPLDHYELSLPSSSLSCLPTPVTVTACTNSSSPCTSPATTLTGQTATLTTSAGSLAASTVSFNASGVATTTLSHPGAANGSAVSVSLSGEQTAAANPRQCCPNGSACSAAGSCGTSFSTAGFVLATSTGGTSATVPTQTAGTGSGNWVLRAVKTGTSTQACEAAITGSTSVNWAAQCNNPGTCSSGNLMTLSATSTGAIAANPGSGVSSSTAVSMTFDANGNAPFSFNYADVGQITLWASKTVNGAALVGNSNAFVVKPAGFAITAVRQTASPNLVNPAAASAAGTKFVKAGEAFSATVTALTSAGAAAPNFGRETSPEGVLLTPTLVLPSGGTPGTLSNSTLVGGSFSAGVITASNLSYSEVGIITLTAAVADGDYLGGGNVSTAGSANIGRFVPAKFALSGGSVTHRSALACSPTSAFSYQGENFRLAFTLTAQNVAGATTQNYSGSFAKLDPTAAAGWNLAGRDGGTAFSAASARLSLGSATGAWSNGVAAGVTLNANVPRAGGPDGPFNAGFGVAPVDSDSVVLGSYDMASTAGGSNDRATVAAVALRHGRLRLANTIGAADRPLALPVSAQSWTGSAWDTNTLDSCTPVPTSAINHGNLRRTLTVADLNASAGITLAAGQGLLRFAAPGGARSGTFDIALSLGSSTDQSCLQSWTPAKPATAGAGLAYLRGAWCGSNLDKDASARITFGLQRTQDNTVYRRENY